MMLNADGMFSTVLLSAATGAAEVSLSIRFRGRTSFTYENPDHVLHQFFASRFSEFRHRF